MASSSLEELLAEEGFKGSKRVTRSRSSFHYGASSEPLYSLEGRLGVSSERLKTQRTKSDASRYQINNHGPRDNLFIISKMDEPLKSEAERKSSRKTNSGKATGNTSSEYMPRNEITELSEQEDSRVKSIYSNSNQVSNAKRGKEKDFKDAKVDKMNSTSSNRKNDSYSRSNSKNKDHAMQAASSLALDEVAVQAVVSILNGYIKRFLKDEDFRSMLRHNCFSSLNFVELEEDNITETKVITSLEQAIETIEQAVEEPISAKYLKRTMMQLSIITGLSLNDLKYESTCGIPNYKLSACAHLYLSVVYMIQKKNKVSAKHLLQVFCDSPFQARTILLPELWENLFSPHLSHLKAWYKKEAEILADTPSKTRKLKLLQKVYKEHLDSGTHKFAAYYKDWLTEGVESPPIPSIGTPSISVTGSQQGSSPCHSSQSASSTDPFSPQPMVSRKLYDSVFGGSSKPGVHEFKINKDEDEQENCVGASFGSTIVKQTVKYESETVKFTDQGVEGFTMGVPVDAFHHQKETSMTAIEEWQKRNLNDDIINSSSLQTNLSSHKVDALSHEKEKELAIRKANKESSSLEGSYFPSIPEEFICPLTKNIFEDPITLETGQTFERKAIQAWFEKGNRTCPVTGNNLECVAMPSTNLILKRLIDNWKSEHFNYLLVIASQTLKYSKELMFKRSDEAAVFELENILSSLKEDNKLTYAKLLISLGVLSFLFRRFELGNMEEKSHTLALLLNCIKADPGCIYQIATSVNRKCLLQLLHSKEFTPLTNAILVLTELLSMKWRKDVTSFISGWAGEDVFNTIQVLLMYLENSSPVEKPLTAVLLLHFDLLVEPQKFRVYREVAVNAFALALDASLDDEKVREKCCRALLILSGHFSSTGKIPTKTSILKQAGFNFPASTYATTEVMEDEEEKGKDQLLVNLLESLIGDGESPFLKTISRCLESRHLDLVTACLMTVVWLTSSLSTLCNAGLHLPAFLAIITQMKAILQNGEPELKILASMSLFNFSKISECRTLLKTMADDIASLLQELVDVTWTAKHLHDIVSM